MLGAGTSFAICSSIEKLQVYATERERESLGVTVTGAGAVPVIVASSTGHEERVRGQRGHHRIHLREVRADAAAQLSAFVAPHAARPSVRFRVIRQTHIHKIE